MKKIIVLIGIFLTITKIFGQQDEFTKAEKCLLNKGEVYFTFDILNKTELIELTKIISVDKLEDLKVFAYANKKEFDKFILLNYNYKVLPHPGDLFIKKVITENLTSQYDFTTYPSYEQYQAIMYQFENDYPGYCKIMDRGNTTNNRKILFAKISDNVNINENEPRIMLTSTMHGDETAGYIIMLRLIDYLLKNYNTNSEIADIVDNMEIWINPLLNPDGTYYSGNSSVQGAIRGNANHIDINRNFPDYIYGEHPDGNATQPETNIIISLFNDFDFDISANFHAGIECAVFPWFTSSTLHPENSWFSSKSSAYANLAQYYGPSGYFTTNGGAVQGGRYIIAHGTISDYLSYYHNCKDVTIELSNTKLLPENQLNNYWNYNYRSILAYLKNVFELKCLNDLSIKSAINGGSKNILANNSIIAYNTISGGAIITYGANNSIKLKPGFKVLSGTIFKTSKIGCANDMNTNFKQNDIISFQELVKDENVIYQNANKEIKIFPNPFNDIINITATEILRKIEIKDVFGKTIIQTDNVNYANQFDLSSYSKGLYFISIYTINHEVIIKKVILN